MDWTAGLFLLGVVLIIMALFSWGRSRKKQSGSNVTAREHLERVKQRQHVRDDLQGLMVEIEQMAKRLGAQLDAKTIHIEKAIREADERIAQLEALKASATPDAGAAQSRSTHDAAPEAERAAHLTPTDNDALDDTADVSPPEEAPPPADAPYTDPLMGRVYALADAGKGPQAIARELHEQVGKVELILALRPA